MPRAVAWCVYLLELAGASLFVYGVSLLNTAAAFICAGVFAVAAAAAVERTFR